MSGGLNMGRKYTYTFNFEESSKEKEGVHFGEKSKKWLVKIKNKTKSAKARPIVVVAQYDKKEDAENHYNRIKD